MMTLYYADFLSSRPVCALAKYLGSPVSWVFLDMTKGEQQTPAYRALNPNCKTPTLVADGQSIWEADAIMCFLALHAGGAMWPGDARQVDVVRWLSWNAQHFTRATGALYFEHIVRPRFNFGPPEAAEVAQSLQDFHRYAAVLDDHLETRAWLVGEAMTVADFKVAMALPYAAEARLPLSDYPAVLRWHDRLNALEAWREPFPSR